jgi:hypothetical protein
MLKKLSLAALVAMGSMSIASASTDLSSAIKGVTIGGYLRYRYTEDNTKTDGKDNHANTTKNEYKAVLNTNIKASNTMTVHGKLAWVDSFKSNDTDKAEKGKAFNVREAYLKYSANDATVKAGLQNVATPLTDHDDDVANGVLATYTVSGITAAAAYFNEFGSAAKGELLSNNVAALAVIADVKPAKVQAWYYNKSDSGDNSKDGAHAYFFDATASVAPVTVKAQYAAAKGNEDGAKTQKFFALAAIANVANVNVTAAYLNFGKDGSDVAAGTKNADGLVAAGDILADKIQQNSDVSKLTLQDGYGVALVAKAKVAGFGVGAQYVHATTNTDKTTSEKTTANEYDLDVSYAYNKKLNFSGYYALLKEDIEDTSADKTINEARFEAKYSF